VAADFENRFFERGGLFGGGALFGRKLGGAGFILDLRESSLAWSGD